MKAFWTALILVLLAASGVNNLMNPGRAMDRILDANLNPAPGKVLKIPDGPPMGLTLLQMRRAARDPGCDVAIYGSCDARTLRPGCFKKGLRVKNYWVPAGNLEDFAAFWLNARAAKKPPRNVILVISPYIFNGETWSRPPDWNLAEADEAFLNSACADDSEDSPGRAVEALARTRRRALAFIKKSFSFRGLRSAADFIPWIADTIEIPRLMEKSNLKLLDLYFDGEENDSTYPGTYGLHEKLARVSYGFLLTPYSRSGARVRLFRKLCRDIRCHGGRLLVLVPPIHPLARKNLEGFCPVAEIERDIRDVLEKAARDGLVERPGGEASYQSLGFSDMDYLDGNHFNEASSEKWLRAGVAGSSYWQSQLARVSGAP